MELKIWILKNGLKMKEFAKKNGISQGYLSLILNQKARPRFQFAQRIEKATNGQITAMYLMSLKYENDTKTTSKKPSCEG